jgi:hypothetical protein
VRQTPYYNTSTQTDVRSYAVKMSDSRPLRHVEIQVSGAGDHAPSAPEMEEKAIQARMSREFQSSDLEPPGASPKKGAAATPVDKRDFFQFPQFEGMQSITAKYATDEDPAEAAQQSGVFQPFPGGDQASIMRKLSEEFYGSSGMRMLGDKRLSSSSSQETSPKPDFSSTLSVYSGTMSQAESYASVVIHPSESAGPFGRDDFGSQSSIADSRHDLSSVVSGGSRGVPRGRNSVEYIPRTQPRPLMESKKFSSLSSIGHHHHQREGSAPALSRHGAQSHESLPKNPGLSVDTRWRGSQRDSGSASDVTSPPSQPASADHKALGSVGSQAESALDSRSSFTSSRGHGRMESVDSVFSEPSPNKDRSFSSKQQSSVDSGNKSPGSGGGFKTEVGRKPSMKKAYGIYDDNEKLFTNSNKNLAAPSSQDANSGPKARGSFSDAVQLDQIKEESGDPSPPVQLRTSNLARHTTQEDISDTRRLDSWRNDLDARTGRPQRPVSEHLTSSSRDRNLRVYEPAARPQRLFDGSIDSGVGSESGSTRAGEVGGPLSPLENTQPGTAELKRLQQQAVRDFVLRKTGRPSLSEHSPDSSLYESIATPRSPHSTHSPHSPTSDPVDVLITKTQENLAKRSESIRRAGSTSSSRASSSDYMDMNRVDRPYKETDWKRLRNSETFQYSSNRSSLCSENTYEDISVFATMTPRGSTQEVPGNAQVRD